MSAKTAGNCIECQEQPPRVRNGRKFKLCQECRATSTSLRWTVRGFKRSLSASTGKLVEFNHGDGWRAGYFLSMTGNYATIQPVGAVGRVPDTITVSLANVKLASLQSPSMPTVEDFYRKMEAMKTKKVMVLVSGPVSPTVFAGLDLAERVDVSARSPLPVQQALENTLLIHGEKDDATFAAKMRKQRPDLPQATKTMPEKLEVGKTYGTYTTHEYVGHSRWKCTDAAGVEKVVYAAELRTAK